MDIKKIIENLGEQYNGKYVILEDGMEFRGVPPMSSPEVSLTYNARLEALLSDDDKGAFIEATFRYSSGSTGSVDTTGMSDEEREFEDIVANFMRHLSRDKASWGDNGGARVFNSGEGYSLLTCSEELANLIISQVKDKLPSGAWIPCYNAGVWYDTEDGIVVEMAAACGN
jgi:hypothetical protein